MASGTKVGQVVQDDISLHFILSYKVPQTGRLKTTEIYSHTVLEARSLKSRCQQGSALLKGSWGESFLTSSSFWCPRHSLALDSITPVSASIFTCHLPVCLSLCLFSSEDTSPVELGPILMTFLEHICKTLLPNKAWGGGGGVGSSLGTQSIYTSHDYSYN